MNNKADIAVIGMGVMGKNLALNLESRGIVVSIYNRTTKTAEDVIAENTDKNLILQTSLEDLVKSLKKPAKIIIMVKAGDPVDSNIEQLLPLLAQGDIIIDAGNSYFKDTERRYKQLKEKGFRYMGLGVSGGEEGARFGPALMPGSDQETYTLLKPFLDAIAAKAKDDVPCSAYIGEGGAGHYVKMVHNGIEYADMELIAEIYYLLKHELKLDNEAMSALFTSWNKTELASYLIDITSTILKEKDDLSNAYMLDQILDVAKQKGTGKWTNIEAIDLAVDSSVLLSGLNARVISMLKDERKEASTHFSKTESVKSKESVKLEDKLEQYRKALLAAKIIAYAQGFSLYRAADTAYGWDLKYDTIASNFRAGCIIRSTLLGNMMEAYKNNRNLKNLMLDPYFTDLLNEAIPALRSTVEEAVAAGYPVPALAMAISYFDAYRTFDSSANMLQAQRDFFGAHTFERVDREGVFHHEWS